MLIVSNFVVNVHWVINNNNNNNNVGMVSYLMEESLVLKETQVWLFRLHLNIAVTVLRLTVA